MAKPPTPSFTEEFPLRTTEADEFILCKRFEAGRHIYNAVLGESLKRMRLMKDSKAWQKARKMKKGKERSKIFNALTVVFGFNSNELEKFAIHCRDGCWIDDHLGSHDMQQMTKRAFIAVQKYAFGKKGKPRFKGKNQVNSMESGNQQNIRYRVIDGKRFLLWDPLSIPLIIDNQEDENTKHVLSCRNKYARILRRTIKGKVRWFVQIVQEGIPLHRRETGKGTVAFDLGPSAIACVSERDAILEPLCPKVQNKDKEVKKLQCKMERSKRAMNPEMFNEDGTKKRGQKTVKTKGTNKKGVKMTKKSARYKKDAKKKAEIERKLAEQRKVEHNELVNRIFGQGNVVKFEKLNYVSWQKNYGRSVGRRAPGMFVSALKRKAESAGVEVVEIEPRTTKLSQFDHKSGTYTKKPLKQRTHYFSDGSCVQRDLYSAWLAMFCDEEKLDASQCSKHWATMEPLLKRAASGSNQFSSWNGFPIPHEVHPPAKPGVEVVGEDRSLKEGALLCEVLDDVISDSNELGTRATKRQQTDLPSKSEISDGG